MIPTIEQIVADLVAGIITKAQAVAWLEQHKRLAADTPSEKGAPVCNRPDGCAFRNNQCSEQGVCLVKHRTVDPTPVDKGGGVNNATGPRGTTVPVSNAYTADQQRVADWIYQRGLGGGDDPIGFLLTSYEFMAGELKTARSASAPIFTVLQLSKAIEYGVNCHSIDAAANVPDFVIASKIAATVHRRLAEIVTQREYVKRITTEEK